MTRPGDGDDFLRTVGARREPDVGGGGLRELPRARGPSSARTMEAQLEPIVRLLAERRWPFRIHATYDESIDALPRPCSSA